jgi:hypothetical protein
MSEAEYRSYAGSQNRAEAEHAEAKAITLTSKEITFMGTTKARARCHR